MNGAADRVLIVRLSSLGDVVHGLAVLHALRESFPDSEIGWAVEEGVSPLLVGHPELTRLHIVKRGEFRGRGLLSRFRAIKALKKELREASYTAAVDLQSLVKSALVTRLSGAPVRIGYAGKEGRPTGGFFHTCRVVPSPVQKHAVERNLSLLVPLGVSTKLARRKAGSSPAEGGQVCVFPDLSAESARLEGFLKSVGCRPAVLHPGAVRPNKRWPLEHFAALGRMIGRKRSLPVVVTWAGDLERSWAETLVKGIGPGAHLGPQVGLRELAALLSASALFVGNDSGPMHMAWALGVPTVAVFGASSGERLGPIGKRTRWIDSRLGCVGCREKSCPFGTARCMREVAPEAVFELVLEVL